MGLRSLLRNVLRSRASREAAETSETADVPTEQGDSPAEPGDSPAGACEAPEIPVSRREFKSISICVSVGPAPIPVQAQSVSEQPIPASFDEKTSDEKTPEGNTSGEKTSDGNASGEKTSGKKTSGKKASGKKARDEEPREKSGDAPEIPAVETADEIGIEVAGEVAGEVAAVPLARVEEVAPGSAGRSVVAAEAVRKCGLDGRRVGVYLVLDRSGSMRGYYKDGTVQHLADQTLALAGRLGEARLPVVFFSTDVDGTAELDPTDHAGRIAELHASYGHMGRTNYHWAIAEVVGHYRASKSPDPALVVFQTDGAPTARAAAARALCHAADLPIFWQFVGFGDPEGRGFDFLRKLDELIVPDQRAVDNAGFFHAGLDPRALSDAEFYGQLLLELPEWLAEAAAAGVVVAPADVLV